VQCLRQLNFHGGGDRYLLVYDAVYSGCQGIGGMNLGSLYRNARLYFSQQLTANFEIFYLLYSFSCPALPHSAHNLKRDRVVTGDKCFETFKTNFCLEYMAAAIRFSLQSGRVCQSSVLDVRWNVGVLWSDTRESWF
jgi:hypothetical protein